MYLFKYNLNKYYITSCELKRGGQIYFLHNEIETIEKMAKDVENLVPEAKVVAIFKYNITNSLLVNEYL